MTERILSVIRTGRSSRHTRVTWSAAAALATVALVSGGCTSGPGNDAKQAAGTAAPAAVTTHTASVTQLPQGVIASIKVPTGTAPFAATAGFGSLWVVGHHGAYVSRVNPRTDKVVAKILVSDSSFIAPMVTAAGVVIATFNGLEVIDPRTNRVIGPLGHVRTGGPPAPALQPSAFGVQTPIGYAHGVPWTFSALPSDPAGGIERLDPLTFRAKGAKYGVNANPHHVTDPDTVATYADGYWWVVNFGDEDGLWGGQVVQVDPRTGQEWHLAVPDPGDGPDLETFGHAIWFKSISNDRLVRMDTRTQRLTTYHLPGFAPLDAFFPQVIDVARGDLWIRIRSGRIVRFDPRKQRVVATYPADPQAGGGFETVAFGSLWVMNYNDDTVWRVRLRN